MGHRHLEGAEPQPLHRLLVLAELAGRIDLHLDLPVGVLLDVLLERERRLVLRLVLAGRLEVGVFERLLLCHR